VRRYLAWESIVHDSDALNLSSHQQRQATSQKQAASTVVDSRIPEAYQWLLVPTQTTPQSDMEWTPFRLTGNESLAVRASKKLRNDEMLIVNLAATRLRLELDNVPLWRGDHVAVKTLIEDFARYTYLPRLRDSGVLINAIAEGLGLLTWDNESFAYADSWDEAGQRYRALRCGQHVAVTEDSTGVLVKPEPARRQYDAERTPTPGTTPGTPTPSGTTPTPAIAGTPTTGSTPSEPPKPKRFHGTVQLNDPQRVGRDAGEIAKEVISHLAGIIGADVKVTIEIDAFIPSGATEQVVRTVTENCRTLKFTSQGFEKD
jgi:hypothetical protein